MLLYCRAESYSTSYSYDSNGNLLTLHRNGQVDAADPPIAIDDLVYTYDEGNQLQNVVDQERHPDGYNDRNPDVRDPGFKYDNYGNLIADRDKEIKEIVYNPACRASVRQVSGRQAPEPSCKDSF